MKYFIAIRVPRQDPAVEYLVAVIAKLLTDAGHTPLIAYQEIAWRGLTPEQFMPYVREEISTSNIVLVVYSPDLRGGLIELGIAYTLKIPIWLVVRKGEPVSSSARACASRMIEYENIPELESVLRRAIDGGLSHAT